MNKLKIALKNNKITFGTWIQIGHPAIAEILSEMGFDWICIDLEHGAIDLENMTNLFRIIEKNNVVPVARIPLNDEIWIHRVLDAGAKGLIVPRINSSLEAEEAIRFSKYPPIGERGYGYSRANSYGYKFDEYVDNNNDEISIIIQIEHVKAVQNINDILSYEDIDGTFIGPLDLKGSLKRQFTNITFDKCLEKYLISSKKKQKTTGIHIIHPTKSNIEKAVADGYKMIALGLDVVLLREKVKEVIEIIKK